MVKIVSGGQTGVDRAALDVALELGISCGGWCPQARLAEDGPINPKYPLRETPSPAYAERTRRNVRDSDATIILTDGSPTGGTAYTIQCAKELEKPHLIVDLSKRIDDIEPVQSWLTMQGVQTLNVAGPRESTCPGIYTRAHAFLKRLVTQG